MYQGPQAYIPPASSYDPTAQRFKRGKKEFYEDPEEMFLRLMKASGMICIMWAINCCACIWSIQAMDFCCLTADMGILPT